MTKESLSLSLNVHSSGKFLWNNLGNKRGVSEWEIINCNLDLWILSNQLHNSLSLNLYYLSQFNPAEMRKMLNTFAYTGGGWVSILLSYLYSPKSSGKSSSWMAQKWFGIKFSSVVTFRVFCNQQAYNWRGWESDSMVFFWWKSDCVEISSQLFYTIYSTPSLLFHFVNNWKAKPQISSWTPFVLPKGEILVRPGKRIRNGNEFWGKCDEWKWTNEKIN